MNDRGAYDASRTHRICAACKFLSKKCTAGCPLAPYFPDENTREFQAVLRVFGVSNLRKMILGVSEADRRLLVESLVMEAFMREKDPVLGIYSEYSRVLNELIHYKTLAQTNSVRILQMQSQVIRMRGDNNGNCHDNMSVPSDHIEWYNGNCPVANLGGAGEVAVTGNETYNNTSMASSRGSDSCTIDGIPFTTNIQSHLHINNNNQEREVASSSATLPPYLPSYIADDLTSSILLQVHEGQ